MRAITRLYPLHHQPGEQPAQPKHVGETVFDSSLHPADSEQLTALHQLGKHEAAPLWRARLNALWRKLCV
ncbi:MULTISPECIES: hypothetical protein [Serratia]|jgi:hypothetical protein|uniref:hypothetical protein n=1 Tax=Serratia TaxID=613 RepID=UPI0002AF2DF6|nr:MULTISPECIES: hypothetical protein [Serratia]AGE16942.1 hypothetical protein SMWW4_v1c11380 [Serratia marcescens WW4]ANM78246.1 hypothetical protein A4U88_2651 [Serratia marcescens]EIT7184591.1 hypothetical protein [Serratia marcescens]EJC6392273.1 hypothetical protein [Serratia marcescens]KMJ15648.1 hypothetical protein SN04_00213 [Serratia marcescens]